MLLAHGADVNARGSYGGTGYLAASQEGDSGRSQLEQEAELNAVRTIVQENIIEHFRLVPHEGNAVQAASYGDHREIVRLLLEHGAKQ